MKIAFIILVVVHGFIHLMGFVKAFELSTVEQITHTISKPMGVMWLIVFIFFITVAILFFLGNAYWWIVGFVAIVISQVLIIIYWQDAKFGTVANLIILIVIISDYGLWGYHYKFEKDVKTLIQSTSNHLSAELTETDIQQLPEHIKTYIRYTGFIGKHKVNNFKAEFKGKIRKNKNSPWMPFTCIQYNFLENATRLFFMNAEMKGIPIGVYHCFHNGIATMDVRLFSLFKIQTMKGIAMNLSETVTFFNDMCVLAPAALIDKRIKWLEVADNKVKASFTNNNITVSAWLYFNKNSELINFISDNRYEGETGKQYPWSTPLKNYQELNGTILMGEATTIYKYPDGEFVYGTFKLTNIEYNI